VGGSYADHPDNGASGGRIVGTLSHGCAIAAILLGLDALLAGILLGSQWSWAAVSMLHRGGNIAAFFALLGGVAMRLMPPVAYTSAPQMCGRAVSKCRDDLCSGPQPDLGTEPLRIRKPPCLVGD
jgi:hypothetical protein